MSEELIGGFDACGSKCSGYKKIPTVSVIIPTHNRPEFLSRALRSVLAQTQLPHEIIVINDAGIAVDNVIAQYNESGIIRYVVHEINRGIAVARNTGLKLAQGDYIALLDDDDMYLPKHLEILVAALKESYCRFAYSFAEYVIEDVRDGELVCVGRHQPYSDIEFSRDDLLVDNFIPTPTWVFCRSLVSETGVFDEFFGALEDWEWLIRAAQKTDFLTVPCVTLEVSQRLNDTQHILAEQRSKLLMWMKAVYDKHPVTSPQIQLARHERVTFGGAKHLNKEQDLALKATFNAAKAGSLDLITLINITETLNAWNLRNRTVLLYQQWIEHIGSSPYLHAVWFNLAVTLHNLGQYSEAVTAYRQSLITSPNFNMARLQLGVLLELGGSLNEALENWRSIVENDKDSSEGQQALAHLARFYSIGISYESQSIFNRKMKLLIKFPTRGRKDKFFHVLDLYYNLLDDIDETRFCITIDEDDLTMNNYEVLDKLSAYKNLNYFVGYSNSKIEAVNANINEHNEFDIILLASDDMIPQIKGYDNIIRSKMEESFLDTDGVLWFYDGQRRDLNTLVCMGRKYYKRFGYIYHSSYKSFYCDNEFTLVAERLKKQTFIDEVIIKHEHPDVEIYRDKLDEMYIENSKYYSIDFSTFKLREKNDFC